MNVGKLLMEEWEASLEAEAELDAEEARKLEGEDEEIGESGRSFCHF